MLVLTRKIKETIIINDDIELKILDVNGSQVKIGINAPRKYQVWRKEIFDKIKAQEQLAGKDDSDLDK